MLHNLRDFAIQRRHLPPSRYANTHEVVIILRKSFRRRRFGSVATALDAKRTGSGGRRGHRGGLTPGVLS